jgi:uncharacterized damage-inducible protein DinB
MAKFLPDIIFEFRRYKSLADRAMVHLDDQQFFHRPAEQVNSVALIVKHVAGNLPSRWTDFLTTDGEKPGRNRDQEFVITKEDTRAALQAAWERGWVVLFDSMESLSEPDLEKSVKIRGESHTVPQALLRSLSHTAYHAGQILYLVRLLKPSSPWLTVPPGKSKQVDGGYFKGK